MSQISLKSITGITSITTPAGVDNVFTVHTNDTTERFRIDPTGNQNISGIVTATTFSGSGASLTSIPAGQLTGTVADARISTLTASKLSGALPAIDGSNLTGIVTGSTADDRQNTYFGTEAGSQLSGGSGSRYNNTFYGYQAGKVNTGIQNVAFGDITFKSNSSGNNNTALGRGALWQSTTANNNTGVGRITLGNVSTGSNNTAVGAQAGYSGTNDITTGSNNLLLGYQATASSATVSNEITLGDSNINHLRIPGIGVSFSEGGGVITGIVTASAFRGDIVPATYHGGRRNMFINGEFMINQRGTRDPQANRDNGANGLGFGGPDHVQLVTNLGAFEAKQANENNSPRSQAGASYSYELDCTSASGPSTSNYTYLNFQWSGVETQRLLYGTSNARPITISFWVQCNKTGNFTATLRNETANKLISSVVTISSSNTWEYKTITFVGDTAAQIAVTISDRWNLELWLDGGNNYTSGTVRTGWTTRDNADRGAGSTLNICSSTSNYFRISLFQVEMGPYATPFEFRTYGEYLHDCEYYFQKPVSSRGSNQAFAIHIWGHKIADTYALRVQSMMRPTEMRVNPTDYFHDGNPSGVTAQRFQTQGSDYEYTYNVGLSIGSNKKEFANGTKYPYGVNGISSAESGILFAYDFESSAEF